MKLAKATLKPRSKTVSRILKLIGKTILLALFCCILFIVLFHQYFNQQWLQLETWLLTNTQTWAENHGFVVSPFYNTAPISITKYKNTLLTALEKAPGIWWHSDSHKLPTFAFDIPPAEYQKILEKRQEALQRGILIKNTNDYVNATLYANNEIYRVAIRLKGDLFDHFAGDKWSLRVKVQGKNTVMGLKRFSIQNPPARGCFEYFLLSSTLAFTGQTIITPRYFFVKEYINGQYIGIMAVEEHFAEEILAVNKKPPGVIIKFNEDILWSHLDAKYGQNIIYDNFYNATIVPFQETASATSPTFTKDYLTSVGLLRGFLYHQLSGKMVFNTDQIGAYLAVLDLWGAPHGMRWNNMRFYFNPQSHKLEPIAFDVEFHLRLPPPILASLTQLNFTPSMSTLLLADPDIQLAYRQAALKLAANIKNGQLAIAIKNTDQQYLKQIGAEFYLYPQTQVDFLQQQLPCLLAKNACQGKQFVGYSPEIARFSTKQALSDNIINVYDERGSSPQLEIMNLIPLRIKIIAIHAYDKNGLELTLQYATPISLPLTLLAAEVNQIPPSTFIKYSTENIDKIDHFTIESTPIIAANQVTLFGTARIYKNKSVLYAAPVGSLAK